MAVTINAPTAGNPLILDIASILNSPLNLGPAPEQRSPLETFIPSALGNLASALTGNERYGAQASRSLEVEEQDRRAELARRSQLTAADFMSRRSDLLHAKSDLLKMQYEAAIATGNIQAESDLLDKRIKNEKELTDIREKGDTLRAHIAANAQRDTANIYANQNNKSRTGNPYLDQLIGQTEERRKIISDLYDTSIKLKYKPNQFQKFLKEHPEAARQLQSFDQAALGKPLEGENAKMFYARAASLTGDLKRAEELTKQHFPKETFEDAPNAVPAGTIKQGAQTAMQRDVSAIGALNRAYMDQQVGTLGMLGLLLQGLGSVGNYFTAPIDTLPPVSRGGGGKY